MNHKTLGYLLSLSLVACAGACDDGAPARTEASQHQSEITPGSPLEKAVLDLVNDANNDARFFDDTVGLDGRAARNIVEHRQGPDGQDGTDDDNLFDDIAELDAVKFVGKKALGQLAAHVDDNGSPDPDTTVSGKLPPAVHWSRNAAEHKAAYIQAFALGRMLVENRDPSLSSWGVALDVDETVLSNSLFQKRQALGTSQGSFFNWIFERKAKALPGAKAFTSFVRSEGGVVAFVTNRPVGPSGAACNATRDNLIAQGFEFDILLCKPPGQSEKEPRWEALEKGTADEDLPAFDIVAYFGDNIHDFPDLEQDIRHEGEDALADFGKKFVVLPNPMTGSWTRNPHQ